MKLKIGIIMIILIILQIMLQNPEFFDKYLKNYLQKK